MTMSGPCLAIATKDCELPPFFLIRDYSWIRDYSHSPSTLALPLAQNLSHSLLACNPALGHL